MTNQIDISSALLRDTLERLSQKENSIQVTQDLIKEQLDQIREQKERLKKRINEPRIIDNR
jgi:uncharacterized protein YukE